MLYAAVVDSTPTQIKLVHDLLDKYDKKAKPMWDNSKPINVSFTVSLYQILELVGGIESVIWIARCSSLTQLIATPL